MLARGATTLTGAWGGTPKNSQNHLMLGHAEAWFHEWLGGIQIDMTKPPTQQITIRPTPVGDITWARVSHESVLGPVECHWESEHEKLTLNVSVPTAATLHLPDGTVKEIAAGSHTLKCSTSTGS